MNCKFCTYLRLLSLPSIAAFLISVLWTPVVAAADFKPDRQEVYKTVGDVELKLHIFESASHQKTDQSPAIVFFFGGGWNGGTPKQFYEQARFLADAGMVAISAEYRVKSRHKTTPFECVADGKSAIRWVREHANELGVDPDRIVASGGSAGGHVAACTGVMLGHDETTEDSSISSVPNAMILFNPVLDTTENGYGLKAVGEDRKTEISPCHHVRAGIAPTLVFHGSSDTTVPIENAERFTRFMKEAGNDCQLETYPGYGHGFFNGKFFRPNTKDLTPYNTMMAKSVAFLQAHGLLNSKPIEEGFSQPKTEVDVVVYGATSAGVIAAVQVSRLGKSVIVLEPGTHVGGLTSGGLGATDIGNKDVIGGLSREFYHRIAKHYQKDESWVHETREEFFQQRSKRTKLNEVLGENATMWTFEPSVADAVFKDMIEEADVTIHLETKLASVKKEGTKIAEITLSDGRRFKAKMFIDASYEGDLMAKSGVRYRVGREANAEYNETLNGIQAKTPKNQMLGRVDPYVVAGDPSSGLLPLIDDGDGGVPGEGDHRVQAYNFRLCFTDVPSNRRELQAPENYDPALYGLALRQVETLVAAESELLIKKFCNPVWMPNRKTDINNSSGISTDYIGANYDYPDADYETRAEIWRKHEDYVQGFWYFMSNDPRIPEELRNQFKEFGPCRDEFLETQGWATQMYVREARRMVSDYVMTEHNCRSKEVAEDSVGMAAYGMDSHNCQRFVKNGIVRNEGDVQKHGLKPYPISYRSIVPSEKECENLIVPVCVSATHIAFGSIRMEPVFMVLGQSAAVAASLAIDDQTSVQGLSYERLRPSLVNTGQVLSRKKKIKK